MPDANEVPYKSQMNTKRIESVKSSSKTFSLALSLKLITLHIL